MSNARPAFATLLAVFLLAFVALAAVAIGHLAAADAARTRDAAADAQLRQLLLAGLDRGEAALANPKGSAPTAPAGLGLALEPGDDESTLLVVASAGRRSAVAIAAWGPASADGRRLLRTTLRPADPR